MKKHILLAIKIFISCLLLIYLLSMIPLAEILSSLKSAGIFFVLIGLILSAAVVFFSAAETRCLARIQGMHLSVFGIVKIHLATTFYSLFLPGILSGGLIKWYMLSKNESKFSAASVVVVNRFLELFFIVLIGLFFFSTAPFTSQGHKLAVVWLFVGLFMALIYLILFNKRLLEFSQQILVNGLLPKFLASMAGRFMTAAKQFQNLQLKQHAQIVGLLLLYHGIGILVFFFFGKSLNLEIDFWVIGWVRSAVVISVMFPISIAGLGIREGLLVFLLNQYGVPPHESIALSFLLFSRNLLFACIGGVLEFQDFAFGKKKRNRNLSNVPSR